jgi:hypothetical protein
MQTLQLQELHLTDEVRQVAQHEGREADEILAEAVRRYLVQHREKRIRAEAEAWYRLPVEVRNQYRGRFVAVYNGKIIDSDLDRMALFKRIRDQVGRQPVLLVEGGDQPMPTYDVHSVRQA